ncbi:homoserine dehydrogenase [Brevibacillus fluminis]|uniref:Homoserine dehydrogenase n=1 Tax=Brevibacillus fluminis TaxID=511487 RepID=A0A3M8DK12_9BACL|nr:homoserine dehydrogenase [Brevibacillus fluminis]RNB87801.1 homoserine dehydrogenase [Brevibacillus fluminis]
MKQWNIVITGFGRVGWHVAELIGKRRERYLQRYQADVRIVGVCGSKKGLYHQAGLPGEQLAALTAASGGLQASPEASEAHTGTAFLQGSGADVVIEAGPTDFVTGGPAYEYITTALRCSMHVISISKGALVFDYPGLKRLAEEHQVMLKISGATAAALPTIDLAEYNLAGCEVSRFVGIFTGTTNFILSKMYQDNVPFEEAVAEAKRRGIAEPDPRFDLEGWDTACKLVILANALFDAGLRLEQIEREGITGITVEQMLQWREQNLVPKLTGEICRTAHGICASVKPRLYPAEHSFAQVNGATKAVMVETDVMGELLVIGGKSDPRAAAAAACKDLEHILMMHKTP